MEEYKLTIIMILGLGIIVLSFFGMTLAFGDMIENNNIDYQSHLYIMSGVSVLLTTLLLIVTKEGIGKMEDRE